MNLSTEPISPSSGCIGRMSSGCQALPYSEEFVFSWLTVKPHCPHRCTMEGHSMQTVIWSSTSPEACSLLSYPPPFLALYILIVTPVWGLKSLQHLTSAKILTSLAYFILSQTLQAHTQGGSRGSVEPPF